MKKVPNGRRVVVGYDPMTGTIYVVYPKPRKTEGEAKVAQGRAPGVAEKAH